MKKSLLFISVVLIAGFIVIACNSLRKIADEEESYMQDWRNEYNRYVFDGKIDKVFAKAATALTSLEYEEVEQHEEDGLIQTGWKDARGRALDEVCWYPVLLPPEEMPPLRGRYAVDMKFRQRGEGSDAKTEVRIRPIIKIREVPGLEEEGKYTAYSVGKIEYDILTAMGAELDPYRNPMEEYYQKDSYDDRDGYDDRGYDDRGRDDRGGRDSYDRGGRDDRGRGYDDRDRYR